MSRNDILRAALSAYVENARCADDAPEHDPDTDLAEEMLDELNAELAALAETSESVPTLTEREIGRRAGIEACGEWLDAVCGQPATAERMVEALTSGRSATDATLDDRAARRVREALAAVSK